MLSVVEKCNEPPGNCQGISHCLENGHPVISESATAVWFYENHAANAIGCRPAAASAVLCVRLHVRDLIYSGHVCIRHLYDTEHNLLATAECLVYFDLLLCSRFS